MTPEDSPRRIRRITELKKLGVALGAYVANLTDAEIDGLISTAGRKRERPISEAGIFRRRKTRR